MNASGHSVYSFDFRGDGQDREFELINELGRDLEPDEIITIRIPKSENSLYYTFASTDDVGVLVYDIVAPRYIPTHCWTMEKLNFCWCGILPGGI